MNAHRTIVGALVAAVILAILPATSSPAAASTRRCEETRHGRVCANLHTPPKGSKMAAEARRFKSSRYLPMDRYTTVVYRGWARRDLTNGRDVFTVRSKRHRHYWHTYTIRLTSKCTPKTWDIEAARKSESYVYRASIPKCEGYVWTLRPTTELPEDAYGWNCWIDGNDDCGDAGRETADGCLSFSTDHYTMCRDGRVYLLDGLRHVAELRRR